MGPYRHHLITEEMIEESRRSMYIDSPEDLYQSYYYQVEECLGIFEESVIFKEYTTKLDEGYVITTRLPGYEIEETMAYVYPLFELEVSEHVRSGANFLKKHDLIGYVDQNKCVLVEEEEALTAIFNEIMREKTPGKNGGGE